jgi:hypothetical protein
LEHARRIAGAINTFIQKQAQFNFDLSQALALVQAKREGASH